MAHRAGTDSDSGVAERPVTAGDRRADIPAPGRATGQIAATGTTAVNRLGSQIAAGQPNTQRSMRIGTGHRQCLPQQEPLPALPSHIGDEPGLRSVPHHQSAHTLYRSNHHRPNHGPDKPRMDR